MARKSETNIKYTPELKIMAVESYLNGEYGGYVLTARFYGLKDKRQLQNWVKIYRENGIEGLFVDNRGKFSKGGGRVKSIKLEEMTLEEQVEYLKMENDVLKKARALLKN